MDDNHGVSVLRAVFAAAKAEDRAVLLPYMTAGLPRRSASVDLFVAMADAGADGFEVGIPYSDPLMDGPTIHEAGLKALAAGTSLDGGLEVVEEVATRTRKPVIVMTYVNPVLRVGLTTFARRAAAAGAVAVILADMPVDESAPFKKAFDATGLGTVLFVAPTTVGDRLRSVAAADPVFVYGIAEVGVTGERTAASDRVVGLAASVRATTDAPLALGVGVSTPDHASRAAEVADGVIVGSALVRRVLDAPDNAAAALALGDAVRDLANAVRR
jgi:tryptophan synthase alpha chain